jgi:hypothetical protein
MPGTFNSYFMSGALGKNEKYLFMIVYDLFRWFAVTAPTHTIENRAKALLYLFRIIDLDGTNLYASYKVHPEDFI